jgi:O-acetyl-ADP-ribose deacetylase (regulator of RNase III)
MIEDSRVYHIGASTLTLRAGDIRKSNAQVLVSSDNHTLLMGGGVSLALAESGGESYRRDGRKMVPATVGDVVVTGGGDLRARYVLHAITLGPRYDIVSEGIPAEVIVRRTTHRVMELLPLLRCRSVAFPQIGGGMAGIGPATIAAEMTGVLVRALLASEEEYEVELFLYDQYGRKPFDALAGFFEPHLRRTLGMEATPVGQAATERRLQVATEPVHAAGPDSPGTAHSRTQVHEMLQYIGDRRDQVDAELVLALGEQDTPPDALARLRRQLEELEALKTLYERRSVETTTGGGGASRARHVFISSTYVDLKEHREALRSLITQHQLGFIGMEDFAPSAQAPADYICRRVQEADHYLGVIGLRYGSVDASSGMSMTEIEYRHAVATNKPLHIFVLDDEAVIRHVNMDRDAVAYGKLLDLRRELMKRHVCKPFSSVADLLEKAGPVVAGLQR